ncbi:ribosomal RNA-processing 7-like [Lecanosticta acicola]|uniref:Ribosomal RNA-processing 7-like n=1 Tax=Lecanosticta acicola TaxID=111012 RepID=A0AAI8Z4U1_9PEZI|nr:ribosomal RNA-processing 7-like [Lecanosticta acicola]
MAPMAPKKIPTTIHDFLVLPLRVPAQPAYPKDATHYLYLRANAPKVPTENTLREAFLVNVPVDATEVHIRSLFADHLGGVRVESIAFEGARVGKGISAPVAPVKQGKKRKREEDDDTEDGKEKAAEVGLLPETWDGELHPSGSTAVVTFVDRESKEMALREVKNAVKSKRKITWGAGIQDRIPVLGSARYLAHHMLCYPDPAVLQASVDAFITAFEAKEEDRKKALARLRSEPDEDGFITVTRGGGAREQENLKAKEEDFKKREKKRVGEDFYRFQTREKKKAEAKDLVRGFEEDVRRVEDMKRRRGKIRPE